MYPAPPFYLAFIVGHCPINPIMNWLVYVRTDSMISASATSINLHLELLETLYLAVNSSLGICRIYFPTSARISGSGLILRMKISPSSQRYGQGQGGYLYGLIFGTCGQTSTFIFTGVYFPQLKKCFRKIPNVITGIQMKLAFVHVVYHESSQVVEPLSPNQPSPMIDSSRWLFCGRI